jgi:hypothetical protein
MNNPENVPAPLEARWQIATMEPCTFKQIDRLTILLEDEGIRPADLFGNGFTRISEVSKWAAHWAIDVLESRWKVRATDELMREAREDLDWRAKRMIADHYYKMNPNLRRGWKP